MPDEHFAESELSVFMGHCLWTAFGMDIVQFVITEQGSRVLTMGFLPAAFKKGLRGRCFQAPRLQIPRYSSHSAWPCSCFLDEWTQPPHLQNESCDSGPHASYGDLWTLSNTFKASCPVIHLEDHKKIVQLRHMLGGWVEARTSFVSRAVPRAEGRS